MQTYAANIMKKNWINFLHNKMIISFIRNCGLYRSTEMDEFGWRASHIQKHFRGYWVRKNLKLGKVFINGRYKGILGLNILKKKFFFFCIEILLY